MNWGGVTGGRGQKHFIQLPLCSVPKLGISGLKSRCAAVLAPSVKCCSVESRMTQGQLYCCQGSRHHGEEAGDASAGAASASSAMWAVCFGCSWDRSYSFSTPEGPVQRASEVTKEKIDESQEQTSRRSPCFWSRPV